MAKRKKRSTRRQSRVASLMIIATAIIMCIVSTVVVSNLNKQSRELSNTEVSLQQQIDQANVERTNLEAQAEYMKTNKYIEDMAKDKLGLVYPDEIVIRPAE